MRAQVCTQGSSRRFAVMVRNNFRVATDSGDEWMCFCPWHHNVNTPAMQVNVASGLWRCFSCGAQGGPKALMRYCGVDVGEEPGLSLADIRAKLNALADGTDTREQQMTPIPESTLRRYMFPTDYWLSRGLTPKTAKAFELGFDPMTGKATIPVRTVNGELLGVIKRNLTNESSVKYRNPKGFKKSHDLFASWLALHDKSSELVLVEGPLDCMKVWQAGFCAMAQYGSELSEYQLRLIRSMGFITITLFFDNDSAGKRALSAAQGFKRRLRGRGEVVEYHRDTDLRNEFVLRSVQYRPGMRNDPGAMQNRDLHAAIVGSTKLT